MLREVYIVVWNREEAFVFTSEEKAIDKVEQITGRARNVWAFDNGDYDDNGNSVWYNEATMEDEL